MLKLHHDSKAKRMLNSISKRTFKSPWGKDVVGGSEGNENVKLSNKEKAAQGQRILKFFDKRGSDEIDEEERTMDKLLKYYSRKKGVTRNTNQSHMLQQIQASHKRKGAEMVQTDPRLFLLSQQVHQKRLRNIREPPRCMCIPGCRTMMTLLLNSQLLKKTQNIDTVRGKGHYSGDERIGDSCNLVKAKVCEVDEDGDLVLTRRRIFDGIVALELGAGTGLVGMLLARVANTVFITDHGDEVLGNCVKNIHLNAGIFHHKGSVYVRELDWNHQWPPSVVENSPSEQSYGWSVSDVEELHKASLLLAADVIYSDDLTDAFFRVLEAIMSNSPEKVLYLALEKRYNFTIDDLDVVANGYSHFRSFIKDGEAFRSLYCHSPVSTILGGMLSSLKLLLTLYFGFSMDDTEEDDLETARSCSFIGRLINLEEIPQYVQEYDRGNDVEIWQIRYAKPKP
ncbi:UNVERIFIED_CONTAM: Methyltransferase-like protein 22 [Sesamum latifolium]|uniref:Methyltransferase-like protein 22 n=1 Tax=Sesamum latifolium TaxID=2727402 RepID=A0AAW2UFD1_9LAMI